jgi:signal transduction histidine kinase
LLLPHHPVEVTQRTSKLDSKGTIFIVDDEPLTRDIMQGFLVREGYDFMFAANGVEALAQLEQGSPDVILLDVMMPELSGFEVCRRLKADERWQHIPVILVTVLDSKEDLVRGFESGADDFLHKPVRDYELRARVRSMLRLKKQYDRLEMALRLREDMAHMIMHDMMNPVSAITGFSSLLMMKNSLLPEDLEDVQKIYAQAQRLNSYLNNMLMVAKMEEAGQLILSLSRVDLRELVQQVEENYEIVARLKRVQIMTELPEQERPVSLDRNLMQRVLDNLISNAIKFSPPGGIVRVWIEYPEHASESQQAPQLRIKIFDQGPGIPEEQRDHIFEKFRISPSEQKGSGQTGFGLGLAFCKMVVEAHGGRIFIEANEPEGSIFRVEI